jgi:hypothetical protein
MTKEECINKYGDSELIGYPAMRAMDDWAKEYGRWLSEQPIGFRTRYTNEESYKLFLNYTTNE